jgi:tol-pal system protein YbgF
MSLILKIKKGKAWYLPGLFLFSGVLATVVFSPVHAQYGGDVDARLNRLENDVSTLGRAVYRGEVPEGAGSMVSSSDAQVNADMQLRIQQLEEQLRAMNGRIEEASFENRQLREVLEKANQDLILRIEDLEGGGAAVSSGAAVEPEDSERIYTNPSSEAQTSPLSDAAAGAVEPQQPQAQTLGVLSSGGDAQGTATAQYENAFSLLKQGNYDNAQVGFEGFLKAYPTHQLAGNAQYWLGETFYVRGQYDQAARVFAEGFSKYPESSKGADNLLKLGITLAAMDKNSDACTALSQIAKQFPDGAQSVIRRAEAEMERLNC